MKFERTSTFLRASAMAFGATFLLSGCLGGGDSASAANGGSLNGVAAVGSPIVGGTVKVVCARGNALTATTSSTGVWQVDLAQQTPPCAVQVSGGTINGVANPTPYHSLATAVGTVNITPLTDLLVANLTGSANPGTWFGSVSAAPGTLSLATPAAVDAALVKLRAALTGLTPLATVNPVTAQFTPTAGNAVDDMLTALATALNNAAVSYAALLGNASQTSFTPPSGFNTVLGNAYAGTTSGGGTGGTGGETGGGTGAGTGGGSDTITIPTLAGNEFGVRFATNGTVMGTAESGVVRFIAGAGGFTVRNGSLLEAYVLDSSDSTLNLDLRWLPNTTGSYACGDGLGAGDDQKTIALGYAVNNGYSSLGTKGVAGFSCNITVTHVGSISGGNYTGYIEGTFKARLFKTGGPVNLADSIVAAGTFRFGTGPVESNGGSGSNVPLASPFVFATDASDQAVMQIMAGEYDVAIVGAPQTSVLGRGKVVVSYAGNDGEVAIALKNAIGTELVKRTAPALSDRNCTDGRCLNLFDRIGSARRISVYNFFDAGNTNASPLAYAGLTFDPSGLLAGNVGTYSVRNGIHAFGAAVPAQFATLAGRYEGTAQQQLCNPNPVVVEISAQGSIRITGKSSVSCAAQDVTVTWDGMDDFISTEADGQIMLKLDSSNIGGSQPGGGITLKLSSSEAPNGFTEARLPLAGAAGDVTTVNAVRR